MSQIEIEAPSGARWAPLHTLVTKVGNVSNVRTVTGLDAASIEDLAKQILDAGRIEVPLIVQKVVYAGKMHEFLWDGQRRNLALEHLLSKKKIDKDFLVPVIDRRPDAVDADDPGFIADVITSQLGIALDREGLSTYELCAAAAQLLKAGKNQAQVAKAIKKSESWVSRMLKAWKHATEDLRTALRDGRITDEQFKDLAEVKQPEKQVEATRDIVDMRANNDRGGAVATARVIAETHREPKDTKKAKAAKPEKAAAAAKAVEKVKVPEVKPAPPAPAKLSKADIADIAKLRQERSGAKHAYVRGVCDAAALFLGLIDEKDLKTPWHAYIKALKKVRG